MKALFKFRALPMFVCALLMSSAVMAQKPVASPRDSVSGTVAGATVKIAYGSPAVKGRQIFGGLVPYDKVWRTGANTMSTFETSKAIKVQGKTLPAGKYSLFTTPGEKEWKIIFNSVTGQWGIKRDGSANDDPAKDVLVVTAKPMKSNAMHERLTFEINKKGFVLLWDNTAVPVSLK
ncbi:MAG TPA: DUF2911 domain-containing protein [Mucilaginibacter sp.]|nr:DUF2911 domain-containing protein [Mucilaginibacter sp.]